MTAPLRSLSAYTVPFCEPKKTRPSASNGDDSEGLGSERNQRIAPVALFSATTRPGLSAWPLERIVTYTVLVVTAGEDAESWPTRRDHTTWPLRLSIAWRTASSPSWNRCSP